MLPQLLQAGASPIFGGKLPDFLTAFGEVEFVLLLVSETKAGAISFCAKLKLESTGVTSSVIFGLICNCSWRLRYSKPSNLNIKSTTEVDTESKFIIVFFKRNTVL